MNDDSSVLERLRSQEFELSIPPHANSWVLRRLLRKHDLVRRLRKDIAEGWISEQEVAHAVSEIIQRLRPGLPCPGRLALCAIAVAMESRQSTFATEFLRELSRLSAEELRDAIQIARTCLQHRGEMASNRTKRFAFPEGMHESMTVCHVVDDLGSKTAESDSTTSLVRERMEPYG